MSPSRLYDVLAIAPRFFLNLPGRGGTHVVIGPDREGQFCYISMVEVTPGRWRPVTGWKLGRRAERLYNSGE
jgi:hypothetical protein